MSDAIEEEFRRIDEILSQALEAFRVAEVDQRLFGSAFLEIGVASLVKAGEHTDSIVANVENLIARLRPT